MVSLLAVLCLVTTRTWAADEAQVEQAILELIAAKNAYADVLAKVTDQASGYANREAYAQALKRHDDAQRAMLRLTGGRMSTALKQKHDPAMREAMRRFEAETRRVRINGPASRGLAGQAPPPAASPAAKPVAEPLGEAEFRAAFADLQSPKTASVKGALLKFIKAGVDVKHQPAVAAALGRLLSHKDEFVRMDAAKALQTWATKQQIPQLGRGTQESLFAIRHNCIRALGQLQDAAAAEFIVKAWKKNTIVATPALIASGPAAEPAVLKVLGSDDEDLEDNAFVVLKKIATAASLPALKERAGQISGYRKEMIEEIIKRLEQPRTK